jgi:hypothetical protein
MALGHDVIRKPQKRFSASCPAREAARSADAVSTMSAKRMARLKREIVAKVKVGAVGAAPNLD